jgi:hypothetical protein
VNLYGKPEHADVVRRLEGLAAQWAKGELAGPGER